jgi:methylmalonyl-CoA mutase N-terminal domain/subunit
MQASMASETKPSEIMAMHPTLSTDTQQTTDKIIADGEFPATKAATHPVNPRRQATGKKSAVAGKKSKSDNATKLKKDSKPKKVKMVRDSYTMPENDYAKHAELKKTCLKAGVHVKKSELLRAGLSTLSKLPTATLLKTVEGLVKIKTGRPGKQ